MKIETRKDNPVTIIGLLLLLVGMLISYITWLAAIGAGIAIGAYIHVELGDR